MAIIDGKSTNDSLLGTDKADSISGNDGNDTITSGAGNDTLSGGNGNDIFVFGSTFATNGLDRITDYTQWNGTTGDRLNLTAALGTTTTIKSLIGNYVYVVSDGVNATVYVDKDGTAGTKYVSQAWATLENVRGGETVRILVDTRYYDLVVPPTITGAGGTLAFVEDGVATPIDSSLTVNYANSGYLTSATVTISSGYVNGQDVLAFATIGSISGSWDATNGRLTLTGNGTAAEYEAALESVTYQNTNTSNPNTGARTVTWSITDGTLTSPSATSYVTVTAQNDAPVLNTASSPALATILEDLASGSNAGTTVGAMVVNSSITDPDLVVTAPEAIYVSAVDNAHGTWQYKVGAGSWTNFDFSGGNAGKGFLLDATDSIRFLPAADYNGTVNITFGAWDKTAGTVGTYADIGVKGGTSAFSSATDTASITITPVNDAPVLTSNGGGASASVSVAENTTAVTTVTATDVDAGASLTYSISGGADSSLFTINGSTGALTFKTAPNYESPVGSDNLYDVTVQVSDGTLTDTQAIAVTVTNVNEAPTITSNSGGDSAAVSVAENSTAVTTVTATDVDAGASLTYSISGGADSSLFTINGSTGALTFKTAPNFESPVGSDNLYDVTVQVSDGTLTDTQAIAVTVTNVNEAPVITSNAGGDSAAVSVAENGTTVTTVTATDVDAGASLTYSISGGADSSLFTINGSTGVLTFKTAPNFEAPVGSDNLYDVTVQVSDGTLTDTQAITVTVTNVNEAPVITSNSGGDSAAVSVAENSTAVTTVTATDVDAGASLTYSITGGADSSLFTIDGSTGALSFITAPDYEAPNDSGPNNVYDVTVQVSDGTLTDTQDIAVTVTDVVESSAPVISAGPTFTETGVTITATSPGGFADPLSLYVGTRELPGFSSGIELALTVQSDIVEGSPVEVFVEDSLDVHDNIAGMTATGFTLALGVSGGETVDRSAQTSSYAIYGFGGNDAISGGSDVDALVGGDGNDTLNGGAGNDSLYGGANDDRVVFDSAAELAADTTVDGGSGTDTLRIESSPAADVVDSDFLHVTGFEILDLSWGTWSVTLGANSNAAFAGGITVQVEESEGSLDLDGSLSTVGITVTATLAADTLIGGSGSDVLNGNGGNDVITGGAGSDNLDGGANNDVLVFDDAATLAGDATVIGGSETDTIRMDSGASALSLADTDFAKVTQVEALALNGTGTQAVTLGTNADAAFATGITITAASASSLNLDGSAAAWTRTIDATGTSNADTLTGGSANDTLIGGSGTDTITGGAGNDSLDGGANNDVLVFDAAATLAGDATVIGGANTDTVRMDSGASALSLADTDFAKVTQVEILTLNGTGTQVVTLGTNTNAAFASGITITAASATTLNLAGGASTVAINATGTGGADTLVGGSGNDALTGGNGTDTITGGTGNDALTGGGGNDTLVGAQDDGLLDGGVGAADLLQIGASFEDASEGQIVNIELMTLTATGLTVSMGDQTEAFTITGFASGASTITGGAGADTITGGSGVDSLSGAGGADSISAGAGDDVLVGDQSDALLDGGADSDVLQIGATFNDSNNGQIANIETVTLIATGLSLTLDAQTEGLTINGFSGGASTIVGGTGSDAITGGSGNDSLKGGSGVDSVNLSTGSDTISLYNILAAADRDTVTGFTAGNGSGFDIVEIKNADTSFSNSGTIVFQDVASAPVSAVSFTTGSKDLIELSFDLAGSGGANDLDGYTDGTALLAALGQTLSVGANTHAGYLLAYQGGNAYLYYLLDRGNGTDISTNTFTIQKEEVTLVGIFSTVGVAEFTTGNFLISA